MNALIEPERRDNQRTDPADAQARPAGRVTRAIAAAKTFAASHTGVVHAYATFAWTDAGAEVTSACGTTLPVPNDSTTRTRRALVTTRDVTCEACQGGDVPGTSPRVEVLVVRDPDGGTDVTVWLDGVRTEYTEESVDAGYGHLRSAWDEHTKDVEQDEHYSPAFKAAVLSARYDWSDTRYIEDDDQ